MKQSGGDFNINENHLQEIHDFLKNLNPSMREVNIITNYKKFLLSIHPDKATGEYDKNIREKMFKIFGTPTTSGTFLFLLKKIEPHVQKLTGHDNFTINDIINLTNVDNVNFNMFKSVLGNNTSETVESEIKTDMIGLLMNFGACCASNASATAIDIDIYHGLLTLFHDVLEEASKIGSNSEISQTCRFLLPNIKKQISTVTHYKNDVIVVKQDGGAGGDDNPCPKVFSSEQWQEWYNRRAEISKTDDTYSKLRRLLNDTTKHPDRLQANAKEMDEVSAIFNKEYPDIDIDLIKTTLNEANNKLVGFKRVKENLIVSFIYGFVALLLSSFSIYSLDEQTAQTVFLVTNLLIVFWKPISQAFSKNIYKNTRVEQLSGFNYNLGLGFIALLILFCGIFFIYGNQDTVAWFAYSGVNVSPDKLEEYKRALNMAVVVGQGGKDVLPGYVDYEHAVKYLNTNMTPAEVDKMIRSLTPPEQIFGHEFVANMYGGKKNKTKKNKIKQNKTKKNKTKPKKHRNTRKNKIIGGLGEGLGVKAAEALGDAARDVAHEGVLVLYKGLDVIEVLARGLRADIIELFKLIGNRKTEASALAKLLKMPKTIIGVLQDVTVGSEGAPRFITEGLQALGAPIKQLNWAANALSYVADKIPKHEKAFSFMGADMYFNFVSTAASVSHSLGGFVSSSYVTAGLVTFNLALEAYPNFCGLINTSFPEKKIYDFAIKDIEETVNEAGNLDCIREYLLMKFYESLDKNTSNIVKIKDDDNDYPDADHPQFSDSAPVSTDALRVNVGTTHPDILSAQVFRFGAQPVNLYTYDTDQITGNPDTNPPVQSTPFKSLAEATRHLSKTFHIANTLNFNSKNYIILKNKLSRVKDTNENFIRKTFLILKVNRTP
jgi:hypothetical protein